MTSTHAAAVLDQFTRMAAAYGSAPHLTSADALDVLLRVTQATASDRSLDVACGAGVIACHFARTVRSAHGVDLTPAMLDQARARQAREQLANVDWTLADGSCLPFADGAFTIVTSRYALHHVQAPHQVLAEIRRVCAPGGRIAVADICLPDDPDEAQLFDRIERLNDRSHVHALTQGEWFALFERVALPPPALLRYAVELPLARMMRAASRSADEIAAAEAEVRQALALGRLRGLAALVDETPVLRYPITVFAVTQPAG